MELIRYRVTGTVQGVFFRQSTQQEATKLGIRGWCHNHPDSSVEGVAAGPTEKLKQFRAFLHRGPSQAQVEKVEIIKQISDANEEQIKQELGTDGEEYEVRKYRG